MAKKDKNTAKDVHAVNITKNIVESSSTPETKEKVKEREERAARRASRRAANAHKPVTAEDIANKRYDILVQYHQLNYSAIQAAIKELGIKPRFVTNTYLTILDVSNDDFNKIKERFIKCHFETDKHKQYKVRIAGYKHNTILKTENKEKKSTNNSATVANKAKMARKAMKKAAFVSRKPKTLADVKTKSHKPATKDTSSRSRKLSKRVKKACRYIAKKEAMKNTVVNHTIVPKKHKTKAVQGALKLAA
ncbi:hypothetical protein [Sharpea azabuensis]|uniref:hypothetical protein n=1 Tax=Sharpea azabuensis TaxID=322505 RepID=UPI00156A6168|nr:hypothetical protein [Sharpea azabuensis]